MHPYLEASLRWTLDSGQSVTNQTHLSRAVRGRFTNELVLRFEMECLSFVNVEESHPERFCWSHFGPFCNLVSSKAVTGPSDHILPRPHCRPVDFTCWLPVAFCPSGLFTFICIQSSFSTLHSLRIGAHANPVNAIAALQPPF
jgi:hypothetical protein